MTTKKPWKPYDVAQALADVDERAGQAISNLTAGLLHDVDQIKARLETEAATFKHLPPDTASLFTTAEHVAIEEVDLSRQGATTLRLRGLSAYTNCGDVRIGAFREPGAELPAKKYRVLAFFLPIED